MLRVIAVVLSFSLPFAAQAECGGPSLEERLSAEQIARVDGRVAEMPFAEGLLWQATRDGRAVTVVGTMHVWDPRLAAIGDRLEPLLAETDLLLLEMTPTEAATMQEAIARDPSLMFLTDGPTLPEMLDEATWAMLADAARERGMPPFLVAKYRPWFLSLMLAAPACALDLMASGSEGLDYMLMDMAKAQGVPMEALEAWDTLFSALETGTIEEQLDFLRAGVLDAELQEEYFVALLDGYFSGEVGRVWELGRVAMDFMPGIDSAEADRLHDMSGTMLLTTRNRAWIPVIEDAAAREARVMVAAGAAHLPGEEGVLNLLERNGWTISRLQ
jgi:uncharacterized protein YbaP (TraB family)